MVAGQLIRTIRSTGRDVSRLFLQRWVAKMKKWLDDEGRIFGKVNLIDLIAVLLLVGIALRALLPVIFLHPGPVHDASLYLEVSRILPEPAGEIALKQEVREQTSGAVLGILSRKDLNPHEAEVVDSEGRLTPGISSRYRDLRLTVTGRARIGKDGALEFDHFPVRAGQTITIYTVTARFDALVLTTEWTD